MKRIALGLTVLATLVGAGQLSAAEFSDRYKATGTLTANADGQEMTLQSWFDTQRNRNSVESNELGSRTIYSVLAATVSEDGKPANPMVQLSFMIGNGMVEPVELWLIDEDFMRPLSAGENGGPLSLTGVVLEDGNLSGDFEGRLVRYDQSTGTLDTSEPEVGISGSFLVTAPDS